MAVLSLNPFCQQCCGFNDALKYHYKINQFIGKDTIGFLYFGIA